MTYSFITTTAEKNFPKVRKLFGKWIVSVAPRTNKDIENSVTIGQTSITHEPTEEEIVEIEKQYITARLPLAIEKKLDEITVYNTSDNVDAFLLNGEKHWLTRDERAMAKLSTEARQRLGHYTTEQCLGGKFYTIPCDTLLTMLAQVEDYALSCFNYAIRQQAEVNALTSLEEVENYDVTKGYPEMLTFTI